MSAQEERFAGTLLRRGEEGYEGARCAAVWNGRKPERYPDVILIAANEADVAKAVRFARANAYAMAIRSGGHSFYGNHLRDGGLLLDLSGLNGVDVSREARTASVGPACRSEALQEVLSGHGLYFPVGTCPTTGIGGYLLGGGFSWAQRLLGPAAHHIRAIDLVTAQGETLHASDEENAEWLWAARGGGPGFPGIITRFHLHLQPLPGAMLTASYVYPVADFAAFIDWYAEVLPETPPEVSMIWLVHYEPDGPPDPVVMFVPLAFGDDERQARALLEPFEHSPLKPRMLAHRAPAAWNYEPAFRFLEAIYHKGHRYFPDSLWVHLDDPGARQAMTRIAQTLPSRQSHLLGAPFIHHQHPNAAFSLSTSLELEIYGICTKPADDARMLEWLGEGIDALLPHSIGSGKINVSNVEARTQSILSRENARRMARFRAAADPDGLFHTALGL